jgi:hypothetical protein
LCAAFARRESSPSWSCSTAKRHSWPQASPRARARAPPPALPAADTRAARKVAGETLKVAAETLKVAAAAWRGQGTTTLSTR